jgi:serine/threonine-protein kinase
LNPAVCPRCGGGLESHDFGSLSETVILSHFGPGAEDDSAAPGTRPAAAAPPIVDPLIGSELDIYRILSLLGRGGMGRVYLARHHNLHRPCALKILLPHLLASEEDYVTRFQNEGRAAASLIHPNIVTIHALGEARGLHFLEMEFVAGRSLQQLIRADGRLNPIRSTALAARIAEGLAAAHRCDIIHRDMKPDNVLLTHQGIPKLADFGLAKRVTSAEATLPEGLLGTPNFMAPELFQGRPANPMSDVYALGVTYYLMLTGKYPFRSESLTSLIVAAATEPVPNVRDLCPEVTLEMAECLSLMLAKDPDQRPRDGIEAAQLLYAVLGDVRDLESLLHEAFDNDSMVNWTRQADRYRVDLRLPDGRGQTLYIEPSSHAAHERLLLIYSICCSAEPAYYEYALRLNSEIPHGGLAIREIDGSPRFIMVDTYPRTTVDAEEIRRSALEIAYRADAVEKLLTGLDCH